MTGGVRLLRFDYETRNDGEAGLSLEYRE